MSRLKRSSLCVLAAALLVTGCAPKQYRMKAAGPAADYFPLAVGDHWTYQFTPGGKRYDETVSKSQPINGVTTYALQIGADYSYVAITPRGVCQFAQSVPGDPTKMVQYDSPQLLYKLPLVVGDTWDEPVQVDIPNAKSQPVQVYGRVESIESATVPAGHFADCVRILIDDPRSAPADQTEIWLAKGVGIVQTRTLIQRSGSLPAKSYETQLCSYVIR